MEWRVLVPTFVFLWKERVPALMGPLKNLVSPPDTPPNLTRRVEL